MKKLLLPLAFSFLSITVVQAKTANIWASIPFIKGANLCQYKQAFSQERTEFMREMSDMAVTLMSGGAAGSEALEMLKEFDQMYDKNVALATRGQYLDVTLERTFQAFLDSYYRNLDVKDKRVNFRHMSDIKQIIRSASYGQRDGNLSSRPYQLVDYVAYGSYSYAPNCKGNISVTLTLVGENGMTKSYSATARPNVVMSRIATQVFEEFQKDQYPTVHRIGNQRLSVLGPVAKERWQRDASQACSYMGGRLPKENELNALARIGVWNGGVTYSPGQYWAIDRTATTYSTDYRKTTPESWSNRKGLHYICVK